MITYTNDTDLYNKVFFTKLDFKSKSFWNLEMAYRVHVVFSVKSLSYF